MSPPEGWWLIGGKWRENYAEIICTAGIMSKADFDARFRDLPALPADAFSNVSAE